MPFSIRQRKKTNRQDNGTRYAHTDRVLQNGGTRLRFQILSVCMVSTRFSSSGASFTPISSEVSRIAAERLVSPDSDGKMLIQRRQPFKRSWSGMWDLTVGGSSVSGDTSLSAAIRETSEELLPRILSRQYQPTLPARLLRTEA